MTCNEIVRNLGQLCTKIVHQRTIYVRINKKSIFCTYMVLFQKKRLNLIKKLKPP